MDFTFNPYALTLVLSSTVVAGLSIFIALKLQDSVRWITFTMLSISVWGFFYGLELTAQTVDDMLFWTRLAYIGLALAPASCIVFSMKYTDYDTSGKPWIYPGIFFLPIVTYVLVLTNSSHHLLYQSNWLNTRGPFPTIGIEKGVWYHVQVIYAYLYYGTAAFILWKRRKHTNPHFRIQTSLLIIGGLMPFLFNVLYQTAWFKPFDGLDITPFGFLFTYFLIAIAILRFNLFDLKPVGREKILEVMARGAVILDRAHKIVDYNSAAKRFWPNPNQLKIGVAAAQLFESHPEILGLLNQNQRQSLLSELESEEGTWNIKVEFVPIADSGTQVAGILLLFENITEQVKTNEQLKKQTSELQQLNNLKDKMFGVISHDLKGPILGVKELIHLTQNGVVTEEEFLEMLPEISKNMHYVSMLLENLLAWASSQLRGEYMITETLDLGKLIHRQKSLLDRLSNEKSITLDVETAGDLWTNADKNMMELIIRNLVSNAIKFSRPGSKVHISCVETQSALLLTVRDFGLGISSENLQKLNAGVSFSTRGQSNEGGTGLGLLLVREYAAKNGGTLSVESVLGEGSTFLISLRKAARPAQLV